MEEEKLMKKTELKHLFRGQKKKKNPPKNKTNKKTSERVESQIANSSLERTKNVTER